MDVIKDVGVGDEDMGDGMQCIDHPYRNNPGGICAFCLQEKLGKLVSSSFPLPLRRSSSSSSSPSFRSDIGGISGGGGGGGGGGGAASAAATSLSLAVRPTPIKGRNDGSGNSNSHYQEYYVRRSRIPFLLAKRKKKIMAASSSSATTSTDRNIVFKRSKSTITSGRRSHFSDNGGDFSPRTRGGFWSFFYLSSTKSTTNSRRTTNKMSSLADTATNANGSMVNPSKEKCVGSSCSLSKRGDIIVVEDDCDDSPNSQATAAASSFDRKVSRSRSVGCGSRSFSGDFFERISTGFGDCTLRRVESQREGKPKVSTSGSNMKERVRCGGIFGGFIITSSSSSSSSSAEETNGKSATAGPLAHGRSRSWSWAFASPMRAFSIKPSSKDGKRDITRQASSRNSAANLFAIPSLLAVRG